MDFSRTAKIGKAWLAGSVSGGAVTALLFSALAGRAANAPGLFLLIFLFASMVFFIGLLVVGLPAWALANRLGRRNWYDGAIIGAVLAYAAFFLWILAAGRATWIEAATISLPLAAAGAVSGLTVWRLIV